MSEPFETFEHAGFTIELHPDWDNPPAPSDWDNLGELVSFSPLWREYAYGKDGQTPGRESTSQEDAAFERGGWRLLERYLLSACGYVCAIPFRFDDYGSGGCSIRETSDDDRMAGFLVTTADRVEELGAPRGDVERQLRGELAEWGQYAAGEVVGYVVRETVQTSSGANVGRVVDSCWGFYPEHFNTGPVGDGLEYVRTEARAAAENEAADRVERARLASFGWGYAHGMRLSAGWSS